MIKDLAIYKHSFDRVVAIIIVLTDSTILKHSSKIIRMRIINHLKEYFLLTTQKESVLNLLNF